MRSWLSLRLLVAVAALTIGLPAIASTVTVGSPSLTINGWTPSLTALNCQSSGSEGQQTCTGTNLAGPDGSDEGTAPDYTLTSWNLSLDPDPTVVGLAAIQNNLLVATTFTFTFLLPIVAQTPFVDIIGSISGSVTDGNGNTAQITDAGTPVYEARIDGVTVQTLIPALNVTTGVFGSSPWGPGSFGPTTLFQPANSNIAIQVKFTLSPGDLASFTSVFNVIAVPEPTTLFLLGGGLVGLLAFGRRYGA